MKTHLHVKILIAYSLFYLVTGFGTEAKNPRFPLPLKDSTKSSNSTNALFLKSLFDPAFIIGTQVKSVVDPALDQWTLPLLSKADKTQLATDQSFPLIVFGDGLAAGWRDGGLFRAAQLTAFPNLVAHQLGLTNFTSPLFDLEHGNGTGYLVSSPKASGPRWIAITNNLAIDNTASIPQLTPYSGGDPSNLAAPKLDRAGLTGTLSPGQGGWIYTQGGQGWTDDMVFLWRLKPQADKSRYTYWDLIQETLTAKKPTIVLSVFGYDTWVDTNVKSDNVQISTFEVHSENSPLTITVAEQAQKKGATGIVFTLPNFKHLPYFNWYPYPKLKKLNSDITLTRTRANILGQEELNDDIILLPTQSVENLFKAAGETKYGVEYPLTDQDVADAQEIVRGSPSFLNLRIKAEAQQKGFPVVDLEALFEKVYAGGFVTEDGFAIDGSSSGNFFSSDGLYPSPIGNAVIANETIKVLNQHFKVNIPLINISEYAQLFAK